MPPKTHDAAASEFVLALGALVRRIRATAPDESQELSWTQRAVLKRLAKEGAATAAELARAENVKPQSMGTAVAGLEQLGLVERKAHPTDGRQLHVALTARGVSFEKRSQEARQTWLGAAMAKLSRQERATLLAAGGIMKKMVEM